MQCKVMPHWIAALSLCALTACGPRNNTRERPPLEALPVDLLRVKPAEAASWRHNRSINSDLNGDGSPERLVLASDVELTKTGVPIWEDGHRWAVFVADASGPTLLYGAFVPNGHSEVAVLNQGADGFRHVLVQERTPSLTRSLVISYNGAGQAKAISEANYHIETWLPNLSTQ